VWRDRIDVRRDDIRLNLVGGVYRLSGTIWIAGAADDRPALGQGINLTFRIGRRAQRLTISTRRACLAPLLYGSLTPSRLFAPVPDDDVVEHFDF
jgi:hypothetical protein